MKIILAIILISVNVSLCQELKFNGNINYLQESNKNLTTNNNIEYIFKIYENHKYLISVSNATHVDLDIFKNEIKETNVFTTLKIKF